MRGMKCRKSRTAHREGLKWAGMKYNALKSRCKFTLSLLSGLERNEKEEVPSFFPLVPSASVSRGRSACPSLSCSRFLLQWVQWTWDQRKERKQETWKGNVMSGGKGEKRGAKLGAFFMLQDAHPFVSHTYRVADKKHEKNEILILRSFNRSVHIMRENRDTHMHTIISHSYDPLLPVSRTSHDDEGHNTRVIRASFHVKGADPCVTHTYNTPTDSL